MGGKLGKKGQREVNRGSANGWNVLLVVYREEKTRIRWKCFTR